MCLRKREMVKHDQISLSCLFFFGEDPRRADSHLTLNFLAGGRRGISPKEALAFCFRLPTTQACVFVWDDLISARGNMGAFFLSSMKTIICFDGR